MTDKNGKLSGKNILILYIFLCLAALILIGAVIFDIAAFGGNRNALFVPDLNGYKSKVILPGCELNFNDTVLLTSSGMLSEEVPLSSKQEIVRQFGYYPLDGVWLPPDLKSCYSRQDIKSRYSDFVRFEFDKPDKLYMAGIFYSHSRDSLNDYNSRTLFFSLSYKPLVRVTDADQESVISKTSHILGTQVTLYHYAGEGRLADSYSADFYYNKLYYSIYAFNGLTEADFINILASVIKK